MWQFTLIRRLGYECLITLPSLVTLAQDMNAVRVHPSILAGHDLQTMLSAAGQLYLLEMLD